MSVRHRARSALAGCAALAAVAAVVLAPSAASAAEPDAQSSLTGIKNIVVIYEENHSFDNLFGGWEGVNGLDKAALDKAAADRTTQVGTDGKALACLPQNDVNLPASPLTCSPAPFANKPFKIDDYIKPGDSTCIKPGANPPTPGAWSHGIPKGDPSSIPGGCTEDLVHRFYQEQYQLGGGKQNRYVAGSDAIGLTMGYYDTKSLPIYTYLHGADAPHYAVADNFFQGAFGGSFLNHQWLIAAKTPTWTGTPPAGKNSIVDADGMPKAYPLHPVNPPGTTVLDGPLTVAKAADGSCKVAICGNYAVNTVQPWHQPYFPGTADADRLPALPDDTIGDRLSDKKVDWAWYAGGWDNAAGNTKGPGWTNGTTAGKCADPRAMPTAVYPNCPDATFQFHHQPFSYFTKYAPGTKARDQHLRDEVEFLDAAQKGKLKPVSFVKPIGEENEHPGYASEPTGSTHLVKLLKAIESGKQADDTMVVVTYDEFGGQWDHVSPPAGDVWGPGTRIPALVISPKLPHKFAVDSTSHDTTSILATIENRFGVKALGDRDKNATDLSSVFGAPAGPGDGSGGGSGGGGLPITGANVAALVAAGLVLLFAGGAAVAWSRRRCPTG